MPGKVKVRIVEARDLPVMDRSSDLADAFAEIRLGNILHRTDVCKKSLNPQWNSEWFRFEVDDEELQDEPLQIRIMDHDTVTAHDAIGKVTINLSPLLTQDPPGSVEGWFPIFDTMHGIRGEVQVIVKVDFVIDINKFRQTSCGVQFFYTCAVPACHKPLAVYGFVEELVVNDDPEYQWIDKIRTPRSSNEARQRLFTKLSGELQRRIGLKVLDVGGNAVIGYRQCFDLEGEFGIVVRGIGTAVYLAKLSSSCPPTPSHPMTASGDLVTTGSQTDVGFVFVETALGTVSTPTKNQFPVSRRRISSSDSEPSSDSPQKDKQTHLGLPGSCGAEGSAGSSTGASFLRSYGHVSSLRTAKNVEDMDFPFFTVTRFPPGFLCHIAGVVTARSVKLLDKINHPDEPETRDAWWSEVRMEIRCHARALGCHAVVGYYESTSICDELIVLSATGTAACINLHFSERAGGQGSLAPILRPATQAVGNADQAHSPDSLEGESTPVEDLSSSPHQNCSLCHVPYSDSSPPFPITLSKCYICRHKKVPDVLFTTIDLPSETLITGTGCLLQARVCRTKRKEKGETNADIVSTILPFLEYELHQQLANKLKVKGMNALFGLHLQISLGDCLVVGTATATAVFLSALPPPPLLRIVGKRTSPEEDKRLNEIQKQIQDTTNKNKARHRITDSCVGNLVLSQDLKGSPLPSPSKSSPASVQVVREDTEQSGVLDLGIDGKDAFVVEVDDKEDEDLIVAVLLDSPIPQGFFYCNVESLPGALTSKPGVQMITSVQRHTFSDDDVRTNQQFAKLFEDTIKSFWFRLRHMSPCCLSNVRFDVEIPEDDNIQVAVTAVAVKVDEREGLEKGSWSSGKRESIKDRALSRLSKTSDSPSDDLQFSIEEVDNAGAERKTQVPCSKLTLEHPIKLKPKVFSQTAFRPAVEVTPMSYLPNAQIERYLGNINLFFIRESHTIRESGGLNVFMQTFLAEAHAVLRAHVLALGGNALVSYQLNELFLLDNPHKHQGQCLLNVSGDAVEVAYINETDLEFGDGLGLVSQKKRTGSYVETNTDTPVFLTRQRSTSASEASSATITSYSSIYGTAI